MFVIYLTIFLALGLIILLGSHYLTYLSFLYFFSITDTATKNILLGTLIFLSVSFILATLLTSLSENVLTRAFYFLSGFWMGFFLNLLMAVLFLWIVVDLSWLLKFNVNISFLAIILFFLAFAYSIYGVWNARHPIIKSIAVTIPNLPQQWKGKKIIQLSDIHIGHINREDFVNDIINKVNAQDSEMILITGDMFDGMDGDLDSPVKLINGLRSSRAASTSAKYPIALASTS